MDTFNHNTDLLAGFDRMEMDFLHANYDCDVDQCDRIARIAEYAFKALVVLSA
jgi:hypothetical protein